ncbi:MAG: MFS transporter [Akkermansiaceae bacterium]|nr:MFS transporter [Akkermansiaceae bacterium]
MERKTSTGPGATGWLWRIFQPSPAIPPAYHGEEEIAGGYRQWRRRILVSTMIGYAIYYFVRKNLSFAMPAMQEELGISKTDLGIFLTLHGLVYGLSRFANGMLADRSNARAMMAVGLLLSALMNVGFGLGSSVMTLGVFWVLNGWVQGMGFPPCARLMTHWFPPAVLASRMSVWNTSHSVGAGLTAVLCGYLASLGWRWCFLVPAVIALFGAIYLWMVLRDTPPSVGLPEVAGTESAENAPHSKESKGVLRKKVFGNPFIWIFALANFFVYIVRYGILDWGPTMLKEAKGYDISHAAGIVAAFEISGVAGMLLAGWLTDRVFGGRGGRVCLFCMVLAGVSLWLFWNLPSGSTVPATICLCAGGFFIYGPQALIGIAVANLATKRAAATAAGFTGIFGYASTVISGWGMGHVVETAGWNGGIMLILGASAIGTVLFMLTWFAGAHGYEDRKKG